MPRAESLAAVEAVKGALEEFIASLVAARKI